MARGILGGPLSASLGTLGWLLGEGSGSEALAGAAANAVGPGARAVSQNAIDPSFTFYPEITTLTETPTITTLTVPVRSIASGIASFFEKINPIGIAIDVTTVAISAIGCAAFE